MTLTIACNENITLYECLYAYITELQRRHGVLKRTIKVNDLTIRGIDKKQCKYQ